MKTRWKGWLQAESLSQQRYKFIIQSNAYPKILLWIVHYIALIICNHYPSITRIRNVCLKEISEIRSRAESSDCEADPYVGLINHNYLCYDKELPNQD